MTLHLYNTLTRRKDEFTPLDAKNVRMYVCGPTVYDRPHLGNARSVVVYDVLYRLLMHLYGEKHVTYVRNITDVDDKINAAAKAKNQSVDSVIERVTEEFHNDMSALNVLSPTKEPKAREHINEMIEMIKQLLKNGYAYEAAHHVLFDITKYRDYGKLSGRNIEEMTAGNRIEVAPYKKHPGDFVLWKPADKDDVYKGDKGSVFESPWGEGRPGWHIECSAMSTTYLSKNFDIHGGGADLMFPHHENEIAQSRCALPGSAFARYWVHNGFLTVNGEKMSKSLGNFITVHDLLDKGVKGEVIRFALLSAKYNEPLDWNEKLLDDAKKAMDRFNFALRSIPPHQMDDEFKFSLPVEIINALSDDLNFPLALNHLHSLATTINNTNDWNIKKGLVAQFIKSLEFLGFIKNQPNLIKLTLSPLAGFRSTPDHQNTILVSSSAATSGTACTISAQWFGVTGVTVTEESNIKAQINARIAAKKTKNFTEADRIRKELSAQGIILEDRPDGTTDWRRA